MDAPGPPRAIRENGAPCTELLLGECGVQNLGENLCSPTVVHRSTISQGAKPIKVIWSFKRKRRPGGTLLKHKATSVVCPSRYAAVGRHCWQNYSPVVNVLSMRLLLVITKIFKLETKAIDFVLAFPRVDLDVDIWMYLPIGFQVDGETAEDSERSYVLKLNKSLYGLKQSSFNWYDKLKTGLQVRGFSPSQIDPYLYFKMGMIV